MSFGQVNVHEIVRKNIILMPFISKIGKQRSKAFSYPAVIQLIEVFELFFICSILPKNIQTNQRNGHIIEFDELKPVLVKIFLMFFGLHVHAHKRSANLLLYFLTFCFI